MSRIHPILVVAVVILLAVAGCGKSGSGSSSLSNISSQSASSSAPSTLPTPSVQQTHIAVVEPPAGTPRLSHAALIAKADAICRRLNDGVATVQTTSLKSVGTTAPELAHYYTKALVSFGKLAPPITLAHDWKEILTEVARARNEILVMGKYALANDPASTVRVENGVGTIQMRRFAIAKRDGLHDCAEI